MSDRDSVHELPEQLQTMLCQRWTYWDRGEVKSSQWCSMHRILYGYQHLQQNNMGYAADRDQTSPLKDLPSRFSLLVCFQQRMRISNLSMTVTKIMTAYPSIASRL